MTTTLFNSVWDTLSAARATVRAGEAVIAKALCVSATQTGQSDDQGMSVSADVAVRYLTTADAQNGETEIGEQIIVTMTESGAEYTFRILARTDTGGILRLTLTDPRS